MPSGRNKDGGSSRNVECKGFVNVSASLRTICLRLTTSDGALMLMFEIFNMECINEFSITEKQLKKKLIYIIKSKRFYCLLFFGAFVP